ncbi:MAG: tol-pal system-associated acyl-CoA thioesterase [Gammaproteobacteria bacterium]|nr:tol-pal system-associated acyl-CoA thioesterase [Gammaproteobacteria bacterium]NNC97165.1 tol-pal system-associated acyl-CoA thioesterase [Gammaproteobacteria bacterium]NNM13642.1 tol-pal system-associated acyl-CoA thioesterase [Gammaproteobacteria bacterium]
MTSAQPHQFSIRVYYENTDAGGVVYHAEYLCFAERARSELLREIGTDQTAMRLEQGLIFVVGHMDCKFIRPAFLDDELRVETVTRKTGKVSMQFEQKIFRDNELLFTAMVKAGCVDAVSYKPKAMPLLVQQQLQKHS